nr:hypothetical protein [Tanacetum cinerariifolium]
RDGGVCWGSVVSGGRVKQAGKVGLSFDGNRVRFTKPTMRSKTPPPRRKENSHPRSKTPQPRRDQGDFTLISLDVFQGFSFFLQIGFTLILATFDGLDVGLLGDVIGEDDYNDDG